jgi:DNA-binding GntR family transcriptional regulator
MEWLPAHPCKYVRCNNIEQPYCQEFLFEVEIFSMSEEDTPTQRIKVPPIEKRTIRERVYTHLREMIIAGEILPGQEITLRGLSTQFGVSIAPVREALFQLESEKVVVRRDNRDYRVNFLTTSQFKEVYSIRRMVEPRLGEQACLIRSDACLTELSHILKRMKASMNDPKRYILNNHEFHFKVYNEAAMPILLEIANSLWARLGPYLSINFKSDRRSLAIHEDMFRAVTHRDPKAFRRALSSDMSYSRSYLLPFISG